MAIIARPSKKSGPAERCRIESVKKHHTCQTYQVGEPHIVIDIATYDGKSGYLEMPVKEAEILLQKLSEALVVKASKTIKQNTFMEKVQAELNKKVK